MMSTFQYRSNNPFAPRVESSQPLQSQSQSQSHQLGQTHSSTNSLFSSTSDSTIPADDGQYCGDGDGERGRLSSDSYNKQESQAQSHPRPNLTIDVNSANARNRARSEGAPAGGAHGRGGVVAGVGGLGTAIRCSGGGDEGTQQQGYQNQNQNQNQETGMDYLSYSQAQAHPGPAGGEEGPIEQYDDAEDGGDGMDHNQHQHQQHQQQMHQAHPHARGGGMIVSHQEEYGQHDDQSDDEFGIQGEGAVNGGGYGGGSIGQVEGAEEDDDDDSSVPDEDIDFDLTYALHTFAATVEGQASVLKGDLLVLLDDANSYWWLVRVLKTEDVGYIPAENIETPYERLARLNKHRNVERAASRPEENHFDLEGRQAQAGGFGGRFLGTKNQIGNEGQHGGTPGGPGGGAQSNTNVGGLDMFSPPMGTSSSNEEEPVIWDNLTAVGGSLSRLPVGNESVDGRKRMVFFGPPTYVSHPGETWSDSSGDEGDADGEDGQREDEEEETGEGDVDVDRIDQLTDQQQYEQDQQQQQQQQQQAQSQHAQQTMQPQNRIVSGSYHPRHARSDSTEGGLEPDDGMSWDDQTVHTQRQQHQQQGQQQQHPNPDQQNHHPPDGVYHPAGSSDRIGIAPSGSSENLIAQINTRDTRRITVTPSVAQDSPLQEEAMGSQRNLPSNLQSGIDSSTSRKISTASSNFSANTYSSMGSNVSTSPEDEEESGGKKLKKKSKPGQEGGTVKKKRSGVFSGLFKKKDKKGSKQEVSEGAVTGGIPRSTSADSDSFIGRSSDDSTLVQANASNPAFNLPQIVMPRNDSPSSPASPGLSPHGARVQQMDQRQQQMYQQYMARSPSNNNLEPASRSYGTQAAATVAQSYAAQRLGRLQPGNAGKGRPSSVLLSPSTATGPMSTLNVVRVFAGDNFHSDSTFKTVLLNASTSTNDLVKQALGRFQIDASETERSGYYLTIKDVEGHQVTVDQESKPLAMFEDVCKRMGAEEERYINTVRRSSIGSISSVSSNLSLNPAIAKLGMNDFSDDSLVKIYLQKRLSPHESLEDPLKTPTQASMSISEMQASVSPQSLPSVRFSLRIIIRPDDLPETLVFDPNSEAILPREHVQILSGSHVPMNERTRTLSMAKSATVGEAIEAGIDRFGIAEGVIDGGDDVEEKPHTRKSIVKVRYILVAKQSGSDEEIHLAPNQRLIDFYHQPPIMKAVERRMSRDWNQESDIQPSDPLFILRKAPSRHSHPLDDIELHRRSLSTSSSTNASADQRQPTTQEIIQRQRAELRANQNAIISAQSNADRGLDVLMADKVTLRSSRTMSVTGDEQVRYSYISSDGETFDISHYVREEWGDTDQTVDQDSQFEELQSPAPLMRQGTETSVYVTAPSTPLEQPAVMKPSPDVFEQLAESRSTPDTTEKLARVLDKIKQARRMSAELRQRSISPASTDKSIDTVRGRATSPTLDTIPESMRQTVYDVPGRSNSRQMTHSPTVMVSRHQRQQPSIASIMSDIATPAPQRPTTPHELLLPRPVRSSLVRPSMPFRLDEVERGIGQSMSVINARAELKRPQQIKKPELNIVDKTYFGPDLPDLTKLPLKVRKHFQPTHDRINKFELELDELVGKLMARA